MPVRGMLRSSGAHGESVRNPLTAALAVMALHAAVSLALGWPVPSVATFLAGTFGVVGAVLAPSRLPRAVGAMAALAVFLPTVVPAPLLAAGVAAMLTPLIPRDRDPFRNFAVALPALTVLVLALIV